MGCTICNCSVDLRLCFLLCKSQVFSICDSNNVHPVLKNELYLVKYSIKSLQDVNNITNRPKKLRIALNTEEKLELM